MALSGVQSSGAEAGNPPGLIFNIAAICVFVALFGVGIAYLIDALGQNKRALPDLWTAGPAVEKIVGDRKLAIPPSWFRFAEQRAPGFADKVDLIFALPLGENNRMTEIGVSLLAKSRGRPSAAMLDAVYLHQFLPEQVDGPPGLVGKPLRPRDGFQNETVWYDPISSAPFVAKCTTPTFNTDEPTCIRTVLLNDQIAATYIFGADALTEWKRFDAEVSKWLARIGGLEKKTP